MAIKTFINENPTLLDEAVNKFETEQLEKGEKVFAGHTDMITFEGKLYHKFVTFYRTK